MKSIMILAIAAVLGCSGNSDRESARPSESDDDDDDHGPPDLGEVTTMAVGDNILLTYDVGEDVEDQSFKALNTRMGLEADAACPNGYEVVNQDVKHGTLWGYESMSWTIRCEEAEAAEPASE